MILHSTEYCVFELKILYCARAQYKEMQAKAYGNFFATRQDCLRKPDSAPIFSLQYQVLYLLMPLR